MNDRYCGICYESINSNVIFGNCGHKICVKCLKKMRGRLCPFCRGSLPNDIIDFISINESNNNESNYEYDFIIDDNLEYINCWKNMLN